MDESERLDVNPMLIAYHRANTLRAYKNLPQLVESGHKPQLQNMLGPELAEETAGTDTAGMHPISSFKVHFPLYCSFPSIHTNFFYQCRVDLDLFRVFMLVLRVRPSRLSHFVLSFSVLHCSIRVSTINLFLRAVFRHLNPCHRHRFYPLHEGDTGASFQPRH